MFRLLIYTLMTIKSPSSFSLLRKERWNCDAAFVSSEATAEFVTILFLEGLSNFVGVPVILLARFPENTYLCRFSSNPPFSRYFLCCKVA